MDILIWSEKPTLARELAGKARTMADKTGGRVVAVQYGLPETVNWDECGVDVVYSCDAPSDPETILAAEAALIRMQQHPADSAQDWADRLARDTSSIRD